MPTRTWNELILEQWRHSSEPAIVDDDGAVSGEELLQLAAGAAGMFDGLGLAPGDAVPLLMEESRTSLALLVAGGLSRRPVAPLGTKLPADDLADAVNALTGRVLLTSPDLAGLAERVSAKTRAEIVVVDRPPAPAGALTGECSGDDTVVVVHTSGTTGKPKPIFLRQRPLAARVAVYQEASGLLVGDRFCSASPFYHTAGVAMDATALGMGVSIVPQDRFSVDNWRRAGRLGTTVALLVPTMIELLLAQGALTDFRPRVLQYGAMPIHPETLRATLDALPGTRLVQIFGQTEASPITCLGPEDHVRAAAGRPDLLLSVGRAVPGADVVVEQPDVEGIGEIAVRARHVFQVDADGWRRTGDLGAIDADGYVTLHGRVNDRIIRGGENIYPVEIEHVLLSHPWVGDAAVVGVPDRKWGEIVKAVIVPATPGQPPDPDELRQLVADRLAHFKVPSVIVFAAELPRNAAGKILRRQLH